MGLCKCPKRNVTSLFCYEHRVNVCDYCVVMNHPRCVVQTYLRWLQDSDYTSQCSLCKESLAEKECIRLSCYHIFHWACLHDHVQHFPETTAPISYKCPSCDGDIVPKENSASPVDETLRLKLSAVNWGRRTLGLPLTTEGSTNLSPTDNATPIETGCLTTARENQIPGEKGITNENLHIRRESIIPVQNIEEKEILRETYENKYKKRDESSKINFLRTKMFPFYQRIRNPGYRRKHKVVILIVFVFLVLFVLCTILSDVPYDNSVLDIMIY